jgi:hypothetical protein
VRAPRNAHRVPGNAVRVPENAVRVPGCFLFKEEETAKLFYAGRKRAGCFLFEEKEIAKLLRVSRISHKVFLARFVTNIVK